MDMLPHVFWTLVICLLLLVGVWLYQRSRSFHHCSGAQTSHRSLLPRRLKPRSLLDCPACCLAALPAVGKEPGTPALGVG
jgi:hypothetical protein